MNDSKKKENRLQRIEAFDSKVKDYFFECNIPLLKNACSKNDDNKLSSLSMISFLVDNIFPKRQFLKKKILKCFYSEQLFATILLHKNKSLLCALEKKAKEKKEQLEENLLRIMIRTNNAVR